MTTSDLIGVCNPPAYSQQPQSCSWDEWPRRGGRSGAAAIDCAAAWDHSGVVWLQLGQLDRAIRSFARALTIRPDFAEALLHRAQARRLQGDDAGARADYDRALNSADGSFTVAVLCNRAALRHATGDPGGAISDIRVALRLDPEAAVDELAQTLRAEGLRDAETALREGQLRHITNRDAFGHASLAVAATLLGRHAEAADHLARFELLAPDLAAFLEWLLDTSRAEGGERLLAPARFGA
jgi:tetratricopeptide (TPR) repeat protein